MNNSNNNANNNANNNNANNNIRRIGLSKRKAPSQLNKPQEILSSQEERDAMSAMDIIENTGNLNVVDEIEISSSESSIESSIESNPFYFSPQYSNNNHSHIDLDFINSNYNNNSNNNQEEIEDLYELEDILKDKVRIAESELKAVRELIKEKEDVNMKLIIINETVVLYKKIISPCIVFDFKNRCIDKNFSEVRCPICLEDLNHENTFLLSCYHSICAICINKAFKECSICRSRIDFAIKKN